MPRLILVCGLPGAGKTTLARRLADEVPAVRLSEDEWLGGLGIDLHDEAARDKLEVLFWRLAQGLLRRGQSVILESGFWAKSDRDEKRLGAHSAGAVVELHFLDVPFNERWRRIEQRNREGAGAGVTREQLAGWERLFEPPAAEEMASFDEVVVERAWGAVGRSSPGRDHLNMVTYSSDIAMLEPSALEGFFEGWPRRPSGSDLLRLLHSSYLAIVALDGDRVVGFISAISDGVLSAHIPLLEVLPDSRGHGIGTELVTRMLGELAHLYAVDLVCDEEMAGFYQRFGLQRMGALGWRRPDSVSG